MDTLNRFLNEMIFRFENIAPTYPLPDRVPTSNIDYQVNMWLQNGAAPHKIIVAIPTHGRSWQLTKESTQTGVPPVHEVSGMQ